MRTSRIGPRDFVATILVALAATVCGVRAEVDAYERPGVTRAVMVVLSLIGAVALVTGILAMTVGSETMLAVLVGATVAVWFATTLRHALTLPDLTVDDVVGADRPRKMAGVR